MSWESIKGFCRRKTQRFSETYRNAPRTHDQTVEAAGEAVFNYQRLTKTTISKMQGVQRNMGELIELLSTVRDDFASMHREDTDMCAQKFNLLVQDMKVKMETLLQSFVSVTAPLARFIEDTDLVKPHIEDRKAKMLEYDFFRNKVAALRASPPSDPSRIPRNEGRVEEWRQAYEESNNKVREMLSGLQATGEQLLTKSAGALTYEVLRYYDGVGQCCRVLVGGSDLLNRARSAVGTATATATAAVANVANNAVNTAMANAAPIVAGATVAVGVAGAVASGGAGSFNAIPTANVLDSTFPSAAQSTPNFLQNTAGPFSNSPKPGKKRNNNDDPFRVG